VVERIGLSQVLRIAELPDEVGGPQQRALLRFLIIDFGS